MFRTKVYKDKHLIEGAKLALKNRLYVSGWQLSCDLQHLVQGLGPNNVLVIGFLDDIPISVALRHYRHLEAFCRKAHRGNGYASKCLSRIDKTNCMAGEGLKGTKKFWAVNGVPMKTWR